MKTLLILRHGHAAPESQAASDHERELTPRGVGEVKRSVAQLLDIGTMPTLILSSTAVRARQSAELCVAAFNAQPQLELLEGLYLAPPQSYEAALLARGGDHARVMVVGHNPGISATAIALAPEAVTGDLPTCGTLTMVVNCPAWERIDRRCVRDAEKDAPAARRFFDFG